MINPLDFGGQVVLVAGGSLATSVEIADTFLAAGAQVIVCGSTKPKNQTEVAGQRTHFMRFEGGNSDDIEACVDAARTRFGRLDVLVCLPTVKPSTSDSASDSAASFVEDGLIAPLHFSRAANQLMQQQAAGGSIINVCSAVEQHSSGTPHAGHAANAGLINLGSSLAVEWAPRVRVNTVTTHLTQTEQSGPTALSDSTAAKDAGNGGSRDVDAAATVGKTCLFLASPLASYISGTALSAGPK